MAPAIVHFLVGATIVLLLAVPFAVRFDFVRRHGVALATIGGLWGLFPDIHHVAPVYDEPLRALHVSVWADLFAFHYTLDRPPVREFSRYGSAFAATLVFLPVAGLFTFAAEWGARTDPGPVDFRMEMVGATVAATIMSVMLLGPILHTTGRISTIASIVGRESGHVGWVLLIVSALIAAGIFSVCLELTTKDPVSVSVSSAVGIALAIPVWLIGSIFVVPLWKMRVFDDSLEIAVGDLAGLVVFALAGGLLCGTYALAIQRLDSPTSETSTPHIHQRN